ncbi:hypothetical protein L6452_09732 [Arctium lappa]|uniref:Uncharacterized protein n=1 Tax=Arctium lappa TaxID=4217 RepID=A0ACB9DKT6_ARCLA|nr:hypothetical protein L6452_09732 [Arctium lappa]
MSIDLGLTIQQHPPIKLPCADLLVSGDWEAAKIIFSRHSELELEMELERYSIIDNHDTPLHIVVCNEHGENFVKELVGMMDINDLKLQNRYGAMATALFVAGNVQMAKVMADKNKELLKILVSQGIMPLNVAALYGRRDMVTYLYASSEKMKDNPWTYENRDCILVKCIGADLFDIALQIVNDCPELATSRNELRTLARKTEDFKRECNPTLRKTIGSATQANSALRLLRMMCDIILEFPKNDVGDIVRGSSDPQDETSTLDVQNHKYISQMLFLAIKEGNTTFVVELISRYPDLLRRVTIRNKVYSMLLSHVVIWIFVVYYIITVQSRIWTSVSNCKAVTKTKKKACGFVTAKKKRREDCGVRVSVCEPL